MPSALGIEAVQWLADGGESLTVRISGRWRRGRPSWSGQPLLVIEGEGGRHRFPAMPEPPSLTGAGPGTWQLSFTVPASLSPRPGTHAWLQLGGAVVVPLPIPDAPGAPAGAPGPSAPLPAPDPQLLAQRRLHSAELAAESAGRRAAEAQAAAERLAEHVEQLERELEQAGLESERLNALLDRRERELRAARQRAHAERAVRLEREDASAAGLRAPPDAAHRLRVHELEDEVELLRRARDEAEHAGRVALSARVEAERRLAEVSTPRSPPARASPGVEVEAKLAELRRELEARVELETVLAELRHELERLRADVEVEHQARLRAEAEAASLRRQLGEQAARSGRAWDAIEQLRSQLLPLEARNGTANGAAAPAVESEPAAGPEVEPERFAEALARLRAERPEDPAAVEMAETTAAAPTAESLPEPATESPPEPVMEPPPEAATESPPEPVTQPPPEPATESPPEPATESPPEPATELPPPLSLQAPAPPGAGWLLRALRDVARTDRPTAALLLAELAPDVAADPARLTARLAHGRVRRALARLRGRRWPPPELRGALNDPQSVAALGLEPRLALALVAAMIDRGRAGPESFTMAYQRPEALDPALYLQIWERDPTVVRDTAPPGRIATTIVCRPEALTAVLEGVEMAETSVRGEEQPLVLMRSWLERARSG